MIRSIFILLLICFLAVLVGCTHNEQDDRIFYGNRKNLYGIKTVLGMFPVKKWEISEMFLYWGQIGISNGVAYFGCHESEPCAVDTKTGKQIWSFDSNTKANLHQLPTSPPVVTNNNVYFANVGGMLFALDAKTGKKIWQVDINDFQHGDSVQKPAFDNQNIYFASKDTVYALDLQTGTIKWNIKTN